MDAQACIQRLTQNSATFQALMGPVSPEDASWRPAPDKWSLIEVTAHLLDEEREDFRTRLDLVLHHPERDWPSINPAGWVEERNYAARNLEETLRHFLDERARSVVWLRGLRSAKWMSTHTHPVLGSIRAGDLLAAWVAHDWLHIRQIARIQWQRIGELAQPFKTEYAGEW